MSGGLESTILINIKISLYSFRSTNSTNYVNKNTEIKFKDSYRRG